MFIYI